MGVESEQVWFDGSLIPYDQANVHVLSHTLHYGLGAFEGIRAYAQEDGTAGIWRLEEHMIRLLQTANMLRIQCPYNKSELEEACQEVLRANAFTDAYLRPLIFLGAGQMGLGARGNTVHTAIAAWHWGAYLGEKGLKDGIRLRTSSFQRNHPNAVMPRAKVVGHYVNSILARYEANDDGFDEALMLDTQGFVAEGTGENVFVFHEGRVYTPPAVNILPGLTRKTVLEMLAHEAIPVVEQCFGRDLLYVADEVFLCGTAAEITPVGELDRRIIGPGGCGPLTKKIQGLYNDAVRGKVPWLSHHITRC
jgi:branched-chain amino acid aminotransferase